MRKNFGRRALLLSLLLVISMLTMACSKEEEISDKLEEAPVEVVEETVKEDGLVLEGQMELKYAEHFKVDYYKDGYKVITDSSDRKILVVPEDKDIPEFEEADLVLKQPLDSFGVYSTIDASWFKPINEIDKIKTVTFEAEKWKTEDMAERVRSGETTYIGSGDAIDYELLTEINPDLNLLSKSNEEKMFPKFDELGLPYLSMGSYMEADPRGRLEWTKLMGVLLDKEEETNEYFEQELARVDEVNKMIEKADLEKPRVTMAYFSASSQDFKITNINGYKVKHIEMAGGSYYPEDIGLDKRGSTSVTPEEFFKIMNETDILIYDSVSGHEIENLDDLLEKADFLADSKVFKEGRIWGLKRDFWQAGEKVADMTEEYYEIFYSPHGEIEETNYFYLMK